MQTLFKITTTIILFFIFLTLIDIRNQHKNKTDEEIEFDNNEFYYDSINKRYWNYTLKGCTEQIEKLKSLNK